jgi:iron(III) transport system permease protein
VIAFLVLLYISLLPYLQVPSTEAFAAMPLDNYREVFHTDLIGRVMWNTVLMVVTSTATAVFSFLVSLVIVRSASGAVSCSTRWLFCLRPIPGMVIGLAMLWLFLQVDKAGIPLFGTIWAITIAFTINFISYSTRARNAAILQIHKRPRRGGQYQRGAPMAGHVADFRLLAAAVLYRDVDLDHAARGAHCRDAASAL